MEPGPVRHLRILLADERQEHLEQVSSVVTRLGHSVVATATSITAAAALSEREQVDVAIVVVDDDTEHALDLIGLIVREATCPVITLLANEDPAFIRQAAKRGVFAYITNGEARDERLESAIEVVLHRFAEYHALEGAFGRRALTERAKGILMERHSVDEERAFQMLRDHSRKGNRKLIEVAQALLDAHTLLPSKDEEEAG